MKKFILIVAFLFLFTVPALAVTTTSIENAVSENSIESQEKAAAKSAVGDTSTLDEAINEDLKSNLKSDYCLNVPVKKDGKIVYSMELEKSGNKYTTIGGEFVNSSDVDIYDKGKIIQLFHSAGIDSVSDLQYVCTNNYSIRLVYVNTPNGEYAITYICPQSSGLTDGKVYKVSDIINTLDKNYNLENKKPQPGFGGVIAASQSAKAIAGKAVKPKSASFNYVPYVYVISGVVLAGIILLAFFKHKKSKTI